MKATDWAYLAGVLDSDGCVTIGKSDSKGRSYYRLCVHITNTSRELIDWLATFFGGTIYLSNPNSPKHYKSAWRWSVRGRDASPILWGVLPYLRVKRERAELGLQFIKTMDRSPQLLTDKQVKQRERIHAILRSMNQLGRVR